jgi:hypothetical protein
MPQHRWTGGSSRICEICNVRQVRTPQGWKPNVSSICPGDDGGYDWSPYGSRLGGGGSNAEMADVAVTEAPRQTSSERRKRRSEALRT